MFFFYLNIFVEAFAQEQKCSCKNVKNCSSYHDKTPPLSITKVLFRGFRCKVQTKWPFKKTLTRFWTANSIKYENVIVGAIERNTSDLELRKGKTKVGKKMFVLFNYLKLSNKN